jgi:hypothetical protein
MLKAKHTILHAIELDVLDGRVVRDSTFRVYDTGIGRDRVRGFCSRRSRRADRRNKRVLTIIVRIPRAPKTPFAWSLHRGCIFLWECSISYMPESRVEN